jgi:8-oxo-dGTP pyrophosphatase MutT (NUDIX family)
MNITVEQRHTIATSQFVKPGGHLAVWDNKNKSLNGEHTRAFVGTSQAGANAPSRSMIAWVNDLLARLRMWRSLKRQNSAFAFIAVGSGVERRYLLQWNDTWQVFNLIGGKLDNSRGDAGSLSRALQRELEEEMGLKNGEDFEIGRCLKTVKMRQYSRRENKAKNYHFGVFDVALFPQLLNNINHPNYAARWLSTRYENVFASAEEIMELSTSDGRAISRTTKRVLQALGELS